MERRDVAPNIAGRARRHRKVHTRVHQELTMTFKVEAARVIAATPERIYGILADYRTGHPSILPPAFTRLEVEEGGYGEGTVFTMTMKAFGQKHDSRVRVTEPE